MKRIAVLFFISFFCIQCMQKSRNQQIILDKRLSIIVDSFIEANPNRGKYELYIDKVTPDSTTMILYAGDKSLLENENRFYKQHPIIQIVSNGISLDIYSGVERYVRNIKEDIKEDTTKRIENYPKAYCLIIDRKGQLHIENRGDSYYPFFILPIKMHDSLFLPPIVNMPDSENTQ